MAEDGKKLGLCKVLYYIIHLQKTLPFIDFLGIHLCAQEKHAVSFMGPDLSIRDILLPLPLEYRASPVILGSGLAADSSTVQSLGNPLKCPGKLYEADS